MENWNREVVFREKGLYEQAGIQALALAKRVGWNNSLVQVL